MVATDPARAEPGFSLPPGSPVLTAVAAATPPSGAPPGAESGLRSTAPSSQDANAVHVQILRRGGADLRLLIKRQNE